MGRTGLAFLVSSIIALSSPASALSEEKLVCEVPTLDNYVTSINRQASNPELMNLLRIDDLAGSYPSVNNEKIIEMIESPPPLISQAIFRSDDPKSDAYDENIDYKGHFLPFPNPNPIKLKKDEVLGAYQNIIEFKDSHNIFQLINKNHDKSKRLELLKDLSSALLNSGFDYTLVKSDCLGFCRTIEVGKGDVVYEATVNIKDAYFNIKSEHVFNAFNAHKSLDESCSEHGVVEICSYRNLDNSDELVVNAYK